MIFSIIFIKTKLSMIFFLILMLKYIELCLNLANSMKIFVKTDTNTYHETGRIVPVFLMKQIKEEQHG